MQGQRKWKGLKPGQIVALGFLIVILVGATILSLPISTRNGEGLNFFDALFTSTSAVCVTGLVVVDTGTTFSIFGQTIIMCLIQIGGLGFMTAATLIWIIARKRITLRQRMVLQESYNTASTQGVVRLGKNVVIMTAIIEGCGALLLSIRMIPEYGFLHGLFNSVFLSVSAFCNAGFDPFGNFASITGYVHDPLMNLVIMTLIVLGGIGFAVIADVVTHRKKKKKLTLHTRIVILTTLCLLVAGTVFFTLEEWNNPATMGDFTPAEKILAGGFQSVTARTAGFNSIDQGAMYPTSKMVTSILMFIGASPASTGGGIKTSTLAVIVLFCISTIKKNNDVVIAERRLPRDTVVKAITIVTLSALLVLGVVIIIGSIEYGRHPDMTLGNIILEVTSAFGTVGLSAGITPILHPMSQTLLILLMYTGRVGLMTLTLALAKQNQAEGIKYPEDRIMVG